MAKRDGLLLSVNAGSSSLKISLFEPSSSSSNPDDAELVQLVLESTIDNLSSPPASFTLEYTDKEQAKNNVKKEEKQDVKDHEGAFAYFLDHLEKTGLKKSSITHVCHRVVHGGDYSEPVVISSEEYHHIEKLTDLAPLHNGAALTVIRTCLTSLKYATSIAYFDTSFHRSIPRHISAYAIDQSIADQRGLKKYGFHGLSYAYILRAVSAHLQKPTAQMSLIVLHLGSGASACAIRRGASLDTSMGLTPVHGLPGATRSGALDPSLIFHYTNKAGRITHEKAHAVDVGVSEAEEILNKQSGWNALAGTKDFREIAKGDTDGKRLAFDMFVDRISAYVGEYFVKLGGEVDALVFSGGIGEKSVELRREVGQRVRCLGFEEVDESKNGDVSDAEGVVVGISAGKGGRRVLVCRTDEQYEMARECVLDDRFWKK